MGEPGSARGMRITKPPGVAKDEIGRSGACLIGKQITSGTANRCSLRQASAANGRFGGTIHREPPRREVSTKMTHSPKTLGIRGSTEVIQCQTS